MKRNEPSFVPQYVRIREEIADAIRSGALRPGDRIPSLREVCLRYEVSMATARRVTSDLMQEGLVLRRAGVGCFVTGSRRRARIALALIGFSEHGWRTNSDMFGQLVGGVAGTVWEHDAILNVLPISDAASALALLDALLDAEPIDGLLLRTAGDVDPTIIDLLARRDMPFVCIKRQVETRTAPCVLSADRSGSFQATAHLLGLGHRRVGLIVSAASSQTARDIELGYRQAHQQFGQAVDESLLQYVPQALDRCGFEATLALRAQPAPPTAIFASSDLLALGVYRAADQLGFAIPDDLAVVGFDDQEIAARLNPPLTTLHFSYYDLGHAAATLLFDLLEGRAPAGAVVIETKLLVRGSSVAVQRTGLRSSDKG